MLYDWDVILAKHEDISTKLTCQLIVNVLFNEDVKINGKIILTC